MDICKNCTNPLIVGENTTQARLTNQDYFCSPCINVRRRETYKKNLEKNREYNRKKFQSRSANEAIWYSAKSRANRGGIEFNLTLDDVIIPSECPILGIPIYRSFGSGSKDNSPSIDRFDPNKGYTKDNITVISSRANRIKNNASIDELSLIIEWMKAKI